MILNSHEMKKQEIVPKYIYLVRSHYLWYMEPSVCMSSVDDNSYVYKTAVSAISVVISRTRVVPSLITNSPRDVSVHL